ncbi:MAG: hypothetical protein GTO45_14650 [Candidatus Aminicenantes bacterium]|nr:hypothetical protein [Candidatus Aminicenantes bacterium]NIN19347.1 hypothetical protein [Candidatus Aminicenantes bacterium]NIN43246.1 hypothetical protein [Candidatus Aminicenantes bacterium]NIN85988.1 hypothetical protein [Candidatus Aminicenantes bacterium]NIO82256.1 hypothetical protein [Candidatus Aminicenantes bacterium]
MRRKIKLSPKGSQFQLAIGKRRSEEVRKRGNEEEKKEKLPGKKRSETVPRQIKP